MAESIRSQIIHPAGNFWVSDLNLSFMIFYFIFFIVFLMWSFFSVACDLTTYILAISFQSSWILYLHLYLPIIPLVFIPFTSFLFLSEKETMFLFLTGLDPMTESLLYPYFLLPQFKQTYSYNPTHVHLLLPPPKNTRSFLFAVTLTECDANFPNFTPHSPPLLWLTY